jgi:hypothetical protein
MKVLITGSRSIQDVAFIFDKLNKHIDRVQDVIIHGGAIGVDNIAEAWCKQNSIKSIIVRPVFESKKEYYLHRNSEMIGMADKIIAFWDGASRGTKFTIDYAKKRNKEVLVLKI